MNIFREIVYVQHEGKHPLIVVYPDSYTGVTVKRNAETQTLMIGSSVAAQIKRVQGKCLICHPQVPKVIVDGISLHHMKGGLPLPPKSCIVVNDHTSVIIFSKGVAAELLTDKPLTERQLDQHSHRQPKAPESLAYNAWYFDQSRPPEHFSVLELALYHQIQRLAKNWK